MVKLMIPASSSDFVPFTDPAELNMALKMLNILLRQEGLSISSITRFNIFCLNDLILCLRVAELIRQYFNKVLIISKISEVNTRNLNKILIAAEKAVIDRLVLYYESFIELYNNRRSLRRLSASIGVSLISDVDNVSEDLEFIVALNKLTPNMTYGILVKPSDILNLARNYDVKFLCRRKWILYDIVPAYTLSTSSNPLFLLVPENENSTLAVLRSGLKLMKINELESINLSILKKYMLDGKSSDTPFISKVSVHIGLRLGENTVLSEDDLLLLKYIDKYKCLKKVAEALNLSYTNIRKRITELERLLGAKLVISRRGGLERGSTELSPLGKEILTSLLPFISHIKNVLSKLKLPRTLDMGNDICYHEFL